MQNEGAADDHDLEAVEQIGAGKAPIKDSEIDSDFDVLSGRHS